MDISNIQDDLHLKDYLNLLGRRRGIALTFYFTVMLFVTIGTILMTPTYRATTTILIDLEAPNMLTTSGSVEMQSQSYYAYKEYFQTQKQIITSRSILKRVFDEFELIKKIQAETEAEALRSFTKKIKAEAVRDTRLLNLHVENKDPVLAAKIANRIAELYVKQNLYFITKEELTNLLKNEYLKLETELSDFSKVYKHKHPKMIRLKQEMEEMIRKIESLKKSSLNYDKDVEDLQDEYSYALEGFKANNVRILDRAEVTEKPVKPKKRINMLLAFIIGIFGGIGLAFFFEYLDDTLQGIIDLKKLVHWPFLGSVPKIEVVGERRKCLVAHHNHKDPVSEAYRSIRTTILYSSPDKQNQKSFVITSPGPSEGKTTTLCNLSIVFAQTKKRVLLVDADMRKPRISSIFKKRNQIGLSSFLNGHKKFNDIIQKTEIENFSIITSGPLPEDTTELLSNDKMKELIRLANDNFDFIFIDSPPIPIVTDGIILSNLTDGVIVVVQKGVTSRRALRQVTQLLKNTHINVIGTILNKSPMLAGSLYYSYYYKKH